MSSVRNLALGLSLGCLASPVFAGGWVSGGGELHRDAQNPWLLDSVDVAHYCVLIDDASFGATRARAEGLIEEALSYWKAELAFGGAAGVGQNVGTQTFIKQPTCDADTDIRFQFGVLDEEQLREIQNPTHFVSLAVRTDYDVEHLRGKGFVYVAPETGPLAPTGGDVVAQPWHVRDGTLLKLALMHELGHVFGLSHMGSNQELMGEGFVERMVSPSFATLVAAQALPHVIRFDSYTIGENCNWPLGDVTRLVARFFGVPSDFKCQKLVLTRTGLTLYAKHDLVATEWKRIGAAETLGVGAYAELDVILKAYDPKTQQSFTLTPWIGIETVLGTYKADDGSVTRQISAYLHPSRPRISGVLNGCLIPSVYSPYTIGWNACEDAP